MKTTYPVEPILCYNEWIKYIHSQAKRVYEKQLK